MIGVSTYGGSLEDTSNKNIDENNVDSFHMPEKELKKAEMSQGRDFKEAAKLQWRPASPCCFCQLLPAAPANNLLPCECPLRSRRVWLWDSNRARITLTYRAVEQGMH